MFNSTILSFPTSWFLKFFDLLENNFKTSKTVSTFKFFNSSEIKMAADAKKIPVLFYCKKSLTFCSTKAISNENKVLFSNAQVAAVLEKSFWMNVSYFQVSLLTFPHKCILTSMLYLIQKMLVLSADWCARTADAQLSQYQGGCIAQRNHSCFPPSSPRFESQLH